MEIQNQEIQPNIQSPVQPEIQPKKTATLWIIVAVLLLAVIGVGAWVLLKKNGPECGNNICEAGEEGICQSDCKTNVQNSETNHPFGLHDPELYKPVEVELFKDLGATAVRVFPAQSIIWDEIEKQKGVYNWSYSDDLINRASGLAEVMVNIFTQSTLYDGTRMPAAPMPKNMEAYKNFLSAAATRYKGKIDIYQIVNEVDAHMMWSGSPQEYALLLKESYQVIKKADPDAKVAIAGISSPMNIDYFKEIFAELKRLGSGQYFDIFDFHWINMEGGNDGYRIYYVPNGMKIDLKAFISEIKKEINNLGYKDVDIYLTELADYTGRPYDYMGKKYLAKHSETYQAISLLKNYVYLIASGVEKIYWSHIFDWESFALNEPNGYFDSVGLVHDGKGDFDEGFGAKKLSYYAYKKMSEVLDGFNSVEVVRESDGIYIYKFIKNDKPVWVAWNDSTQTKRVSITLTEKAKGADVFKSIPKQSIGKEVLNYNSAFFEVSANLMESYPMQISFELDDVPVYIEEN